MENNLKMKSACRCLIAGMLVLCTSVFADQAVLVQEAVLVESNPNPDEPVARASYMTSDGWAVTSKTYVDAAVMVFDFGTVAKVSSAYVSLPLEALYPRDGQAPLRVFAFADDGVIDLFDYKAGSVIPVAEFDAVKASGANSTATLTVDVTGAVNAILPNSRFVGIRVESAAVPAEVSSGFPAWTGVKFRPLYSMDFSVGTPPAMPADRPRFDGFTLSVPGLSAPGVGAFNVAMDLVDINVGEFELSAVADITPPGSVSGAGRRGMELLNCTEFTAPSGSEFLTPGTPAYNSLTGELNIPSMLYADKEYRMQMAYVAGSNPMRFRLLSLAEVLVGAPVPAVSIAQFGGNLLLEPTLDFLPLCHGWVLIGDMARNALVERNVITGETGAVYKFNTIPGEMLLDPDAGRVFFATHPPSLRMYQLDIPSGAFTFHRLTEGGRDFVPVDIALGENGEVFTLLFDPLYGLEENGPAKEGLWLGIFNKNGVATTATIPLESPVKIEYDRVKRHVFLITESNLVTFDFNPDTRAITFVPGTDIPVGSSCTDFSISPDGERIAYSCPEGNEQEPHTAIVDMDPRKYYDADGEWYLENAPVSAIFDRSGEVLIASDGIKLYFFDVKTHLLHSSFSLELEAGETLKKLRLSLDGKFVLMLLETGLNDPQSKIYWVALPEFFPL
jgi:hypothetical protein